jgi:hypothetical protein
MCASRPVYCERHSGRPHQQRRASPADHPIQHETDEAAVGANDTAEALTELSGELDATVRNGAFEHQLIARMVFDDDSGHRHNRGGGRQHRERCAEG